MNILITGGAGFIASNLAEKLLQDNNVVAVDNLSLGNKDNLINCLSNKNFNFYKLDVNNTKKLCTIIRKHNIEMIYHLAANSDIQKSAKDPTIDARNTFNTTLSVLQAMKICNLKKLFFSSTSAVYGDKTDVLLNEKTGELKPISYYGAGKLSSEAFISAYSYMNDMEVVIFRFPNVIGPKLTHGVIYDFYKKLQNNPNKLQILGNGTQCKPYIYVEDLVDVIIQRTKKIEIGVELYTVGVDSATTVTRIAEIVVDVMKLKGVQFEYTGGNVGWKGDVPTFKYDMAKIWATGWKAKYSSDEAVRKTVEWIINK